MWLHLHVGHGKTGSSYLQSWLAINADALRERHGLVYPLRSPVSGTADDRAQRSRFSMGNGFILEELLGLDDAQAACRALSELRGRAPSLLFSRERFMRDLPPQITRIETLALDSGFRGVRYLLFIRDPLEHVLSLYAEMVKAHGCCASPGDWLDGYEFLDYVEAFFAAARSRSHAELSVVNYSKSRGRLLEHLRNWLSVDASGDLPRPAHDRVNRSLTAPELRVQRVANRLLGHEAAAIGKRLVDELPGITGPVPRASRDAQRRFVERLRPQVDRLNRSVPEDQRYSLEAVRASDDADAPTDGVLGLGADQLAVVAAGFISCAGRRVLSAIRRAAR